MTDVSETSIPTTAPTEAPEQKFAKGDEVLVMRGSDKDKSGTILGVDTRKYQYAISYPDGSFGVQNFVNVKAVTEGAITAGKLAGLVHEWDVDGAGESLAYFLGARVPGFTKAYEQS
jgi:hypothetical protein